MLPYHGCQHFWKINSRYIPGFPGPKLMDSRYILHENHGEIKVLYLIEIESTGKSILYTFFRDWYIDWLLT